ncbi:MAG: hypothetical protein RL264_2242 [Bacteroidota bacterium]
MWVSVTYAMNLYFRVVVTINRPRKFYNRTIYASNHASSFMDPLVIGGFNRALVFFMTRSDVFTTFSRPFLWAAHMLPIYRQQDGVDTKEKNMEVFREVYKILKSKRSPLIFAEGFTDDVFVRRLKPIKKGAARMGFSALDACDWKMDIKMAAVGCNYTNPHLIRSSLLIKTSDEFSLLEYADVYRENPGLAINQVTERLNRHMLDQITHVEREEWCDFHEHIMTITGKGMHEELDGNKIDLKERFRYSKELANWLNEFDNELSQELEQLKGDLASFFSILYKNHLPLSALKDASVKNSKWFLLHLLKLLLLLPFSILGCLHIAPAFLVAKKFVEKKFKRSVFWGSAKMLISLIIAGLYNIVLVTVVASYLDVEWYFGTLYYFSIGVFWWAFLESRQIIRKIKNRSKIKKMDVDELYGMFNRLASKIDDLIPVK